MSARVVIVGRPNVGKSSLFNRLIGRRNALVNRQSGLTRDVHAKEVDFCALQFVAIDTAGLLLYEKKALQSRMNAQTISALSTATVVLFVVSAQEGMTAQDQEIAQVLRSFDKEIVLVCNKSEGHASHAMDAWELQLGEPIFISSAHGLGLVDLGGALAESMRKADARLPSHQEPPTKTMPSADKDSPLEVPTPDTFSPDMPSSERPIRLVLLGRPNVGKSTLANALLGHERQLTGPEPGITRDAIRLPLRHRTQTFALYDTAGLTRRLRMSEDSDSLARKSALSALRYAEVVALLVDAETGLHKQDAHLAAQIHVQGRACVLALNKCDLISSPLRQHRSRIISEMSSALPQWGNIDVVPLSAKHKQGTAALLRAVVHAHRAWNRHIATSKLNRWLTQSVQKHPPKVARGKPSVFRYATQISTRPPHIALFCTRPHNVHLSYVRFLKNQLDECFSWTGTPIRFSLRCTSSQKKDVRQRSAPLRV